MSGAARWPRPDRAALAGTLALAWCLAGGAAWAQSDGGVHGRFEIQEAGQFAPGDSLEAAVGAQAANDLMGNLRVAWDPTWGRWSLQAQYLASVDFGGEVLLQRTEQALLPPPPSSWFNLTDTFVDNGQVIGSQGVDRLALTYAAPDLVVRIGRQAITWGSGLVFRPMDLIDPFSPSATDTEYKPGVDMLYVQRLFAGGADLQFVVAPRPAQYAAQPSLNASTLALNLHAALLGHQTTWMLALDHGDFVGGLGVNGPLGGATWNVEVLPTFEAAGPVRVSALANLSDAVSLFHRNATIFGEYFYNGFGVASGGAAFSTLPPALSARLARGQLFTTGCDYLAGGMTLELTPLLTVSPTLIIDLNDGSLFPLFAATYSLSDNLTLVGGVQAPIGPRGTEYGGLPVTPTDGVFAPPPAQVYIQLRRYF